MVASRMEETKPTQWKEQERHALFLQQARGIGNTAEDNEKTPHHPLKLNEDEPWERSLSKLLRDSSSSLHSLASRKNSDSSGIFLLEHSESRDRCFETDHPEEEISVGPRTPSSSIYRSISAAHHRDISLIDSSLDDASETTHSSITSKLSRTTTALYHGRSSVRSCDDVFFDEYRQDQVGYREIMSRRAQICIARQQHRDMFSPAHSFDDVTHFTHEVTLPYLPSLDEPSTMDDSNTVRRLPPRYDAQTAQLLGDTRMFEFPSLRDRAEDSSQ